MSLSPEQIDWIVHEVVRRLREMGVDAPDATAAGSPAAGELVLSERVIATEMLTHRLAGVTALRVTKRAIVTPAVRDLLRDHGVELVREN